MTFKHIVLFNARRLSLQAMPFPRLLKHQEVYPQNPIIPVSLLLPRGEKMSQEIDIYKASYSLTSTHLHIYIIHICLHGHTGFLEKICSHLNIRQCRRQLCIQKKWRSVENRAMLRGILQPRQSVPKTACTPQRINRVCYQK